MGNKKSAEVKKILFNPECSNNDTLYDESKLRLREMTSENEKLKSYTLKHFEMLHKTPLYEERWTNNNTESINNVIKQEIQWKPQTVQNLISKLEILVDRKIFDLRSSLHNYGDYILATNYQRYAKNSALWNSLTEAQRQKIFQNFLDDNLRIGSSEKIISERKNPGIAKKPNQQKRSRSERAR